MSKYEMAFPSDAIAARGSRFNPETPKFKVEMRVALLHFCVVIYRVSQEECARLREDVPYVKVYRYNPKQLCPNLNGYGDNGQRSLKL